MDKKNSGLGGDLCIWIEDKGGPDAITIDDVFVIIDSYLFEIPPNGYIFIPTAPNVFGVINYYLGFDGDAMVGCNFYGLRVENLTVPAEVNPNTAFDVKYDCYNAGATDMMWGHLIDRKMGVKFPGSEWEAEIIADGTKHVITHFDGIGTEFHGRVEVGHVSMGMNISKRYIVDYVVDIGK